MEVWGAKAIRRVKILEISVDALLYEMIPRKYPTIRTFEGLPHDAKVVGVALSPTPNSIRVLVESEGFDEVRMSGEIPRFDVAVTEHSLWDTSLRQLWALGRGE